MPVNIVVPVIGGIAAASAVAYLYNKYLSEKVEGYVLGVLEARRLRRERQKEERAGAIPLRAVAVPASSHEGDSSDSDDDEEERERAEERTVYASGREEGDPVRQRYGWLRTNASQEATPRSGSPNAGAVAIPLSASLLLPRSSLRPDLSSHSSSTSTAPTPTSPSVYSDFAISPPPSVMSEASTSASSPSFEHVALPSFASVLVEPSPLFSRTSTVRSSTDAGSAADDVTDGWSDVGSHRT